MATHCQGSGECQNIGGRSAHLKAKKGAVNLKLKNQIGVVTCKMCLFCEIHIHFMKCLVEKMESLLYTILHWESLILE